jgi:hypothetical protein
VTLPIVLAGIEGGHAVANAVFGSPEGVKELFASPSSGSGILPIVALLAAGLVVLGLACRFAPRCWFPRQAQAIALPFVLLPPVSFMLLELTEAAVSRGAIPWHEAVRPTFVFGLVLQLPFALLGYALARLLLRVTDGVRRLFARSFRSRLLPLAAAPSPRSADRALQGTRRGSPRLGRAPPAALAASR